MNTKIKKEEVLTNINQTQQTEKNIEYLMRELITLEIFDTDVKNIFNLEYLKECLEGLETHEYNIERGIISIKERISEIQDNYDGEEEEVKENLIQIEELERFIEKVCDTEEDEEVPLSEIEDLLRESIDNLNNHLSDVILNVKLIPNPKYMVEPNNSELMWSEDDTHKFNLLKNRIHCLEEELETIKN